MFLPWDSYEVRWNGHFYTTLLVYIFPSSSLFRDFWSEKLHKDKNNYCFESVINWKKKNTYYLFISSLFLSQAAWDISERSSIRSPLRETSQRLFRKSQKRWLFCGVFKMSEIHLKKDVFFKTSLRHLKNISKVTSFV